MPWFHVGIGHQDMITAGCQVQFCIQKKGIVPGQALSPVLFLFMQTLQNAVPL